MQIYLREIPHFRIPPKRSRPQSGNPNHEGIPDWPPYSVERRPTMMFDNQCRVENDPYRAERMAWGA